MFRQTLSEWRAEFPSPHTRGDVPSICAMRRREGLFSPHTWGCSAHTGGSRHARRLLPTHVGMFLLRHAPPGGARPSPHTRGDVPLAGALRFHSPAFSPHTWGCSGQKKLIMSSGGNLIVVDDYCKSRAEAVSETVRRAKAGATTKSRSTCRKRGTKGLGTRTRTASSIRAGAPGAMPRISKCSPALRLPGSTATRR